MTTPAVRPPLTVLIRRFWRLAFRSQSAGFKFIAGLSAVVLAVGVGTALVGFDDSGTARLHQADAPGANGGPGGQPTGPAAGPSASTGPGKTAGNTGTNGSGKGAGNSNGGGTHGPVCCHNPAGRPGHGVSATKIDIVIPIPNLGAVQSA